MSWDGTEPGKSDGVRWAVGERSGRRSSTYRSWGNKQGDFFLAARSIGGSLTSLHRDGRCHTGLTSGYAEKHAVAQRHLDRWTIPLEHMVKAVQAVVAEEDLAFYPSQDAEPVRWLRSPRPGHIALVGIVVLPSSALSQLGSLWPSATEGTGPVGVVATSDRTAFAVRWENPFEPNQIVELQALRARISNDVARRQVTPAFGLRAVVLGNLGDGASATRSLFDIAYPGDA